MAVGHFTFFQHGSPSLRAAFLHQKDAAPPSKFFNQICLAHPLKNSGWESNPLKPETWWRTICLPNSYQIAFDFYILRSKKAKRYKAIAGKLRGKSLFGETGKFLLLHVKYFCSASAGFLDKM
ncbi:hypothetical protein [Bacillus glycinifermentans]|uniref:Uncharacterized protein n=1 Tax=Bacillus glycinifermentans TaxID=1664069 RepID=A0ABU6H682_9BACI|nr:hypothetical protein [Bacillus glycinifermentans]MEC0486509.1 hypothetical protein [Bacillus glycinifermentans]MEC0494156.1 hypothetical protein [Bacillus glycinifermentans]MEC0543177.1 hypothetical protein [Bacillus glycinifermentans]MEC3609517.1 hypothetical protein [Bacillus glycinifermentans]UOY88252.1 hypothetical protein MW696_19875 [Bacillus glycinifermentans]